MNKWLLIMALLPFQVSADGTVASITISGFKKNAELCEHFAGEWDSDLPKSDKKSIEKSIDKYCAMAQRQRIYLKKKLKGQNELLKELDQFDSVNSFAK